MGLFTAAGLCASAPIRSVVQICHIRGPALRADPCVVRQSATVRSNIVTVFGPGGLGNRFSSLFSHKPLHLGPGVEQLPLLGFDLALQHSYLFAAFTALHHLVKGFFPGLLKQCSQVLYLNFLYLLIVAQTFRRRSERTFRNKRNNFSC